MQRKAKRYEDTRLVHRRRLKRRYSGPRSRKNCALSPQAEVLPTASFLLVSHHTQMSLMKFVVLLGTDMSRIVSVEECEGDCAAA